MQMIAIPLQTETRPEEGLALTWVEVPDAIRYGLIVGIPEVPMPDLDVIMRGQTKQFAIVGVPARFSGVVDIGTPTGETRQFGLVAYRSDGSIMPVPTLRIHPARSAPRDREYHPVVPPALVDPRPAPPAPSDPWGALEAAGGQGTDASQSSSTPFVPAGSAGDAITSTASTPVMPSTPAPHDPWDFLSQQHVETPGSEPSLATPDSSPVARATEPQEPPVSPATITVAAVPEPTPAVSPAAALAEPAAEHAVEATSTIPAAFEAEPLPVAEPIGPEVAAAIAQAPEEPQPASPIETPSTPPTHVPPVMHMEAPRETDLAGAPEPVAPTLQADVPQTSPAPPADTTPLPAALAALLDEAEIYLLPQWADYAEATRLVEQVEQEAPNHVRTRDLRARIDAARHAGDSVHVTTLLEQAERCMAAQDYWAAVDLYEEVLGEQPEHDSARVGLARARLRARWPAQLTGASGNVDALRELGDQYAGPAPDLAAQAYAAAFAIQPAVDTLHSWLLAFLQAEQGVAVATTARRAVRLLEESGQVRANPAYASALEDLERLVSEGSVETEAAIARLCDLLKSASL